MSFLLTVQGQERKDLVVSGSTGVINSPYYFNANAGMFFRIDFDYHITGRHILSANYLSGNHGYFEDVLSNDPTSTLYGDGTNAVADYRTFSVMYKYKVISTGKISIVPGTGAGILTHTRQFPYREGNTWYKQKSSWSSLAFPVRLDINYKVSDRWQLGATGGFLIHPDGDYPIIAMHAGPKLSFILP